MKHRLIFATGNLHKLLEAKLLLEDIAEISGAEQAGLDAGVQETAGTLMENAKIKAEHVFRQCGADCFGEDTGLEIDFLGGAPGVLSARYAGPGRDARENTRLVLRKMAGAADRSARFRTVICLLFRGEAFYFDGVLEGEITREPAGAAGFGYDPVFLPAGSRKTLAEMAVEEKNLISHRGMAFRKLSAWLRSRPGE